MKFKNWDVVELLQNFPNLQVSMSLDGVGETGGYIREGLEYSKCLANARRIQRELPHAKRNLHFVVSIFNVIDLPAHDRAIVREQVVDPSRISFTFLAWPEFLDAQVLQVGIKEKVERDLRRFLETEADLPEAIGKQMEHSSIFCARKISMALTLTCLLRKPDCWTAHAARMPRSCSLC